MTKELEAARERLADATRPIIGLENRTRQEVFDIMSDRIRFVVAMLERAALSHMGGGDE